MIRTIEIKNEKALKLLESLESNDFIKFKETGEDKMRFLLGLKAKNSSRDNLFNDLKGIWKEREISLEQIKSKAWPKRK